MDAPMRRRIRGWASTGIGTRSSGCEVQSRSSYGRTAQTYWRSPKQNLGSIREGVDPAALSKDAHHGRPRDGARLSKHEDREGTRAHDPAIAARARRRGNPVIDRRSFISCSLALWVTAPLVASAQQA